MTEEAKKRIEENIKNKGFKLYLGACGITGKELILTKLTKNVNLKYIDLGFNHILDISFLRKLENLQYLNLYESQVLVNHTFLAELKNLQAMNLCGNRIQDISFLKDLKQLQKLNLSSNKIQDISFLKDLKQLQKLNLSSNKIQDISFLENLENLEILILDHNEIRDISLLGRLKSLNTLSLNDNNIQDISSLKQLKKIKKINLNLNQIQNTSSLRDMKSLKMIDLRANQIETISLVFFNSLLNLEEIYLHQNPIENIPIEIFDKDENVLEDVRNYLEAVEKEKSYLQGGKMILIGNGEVGKSSIRLKLLNKDAILPEKDERTQGIDLAVETYPVKDIPTKLTKLLQNINFDLHIWDFGGQGRYREVQQLFCSRKSLYLFVTSYDDKPTKEDYVGFEYWLSMANAFNYDEDNKVHSPVIHVWNKIDIQEFANFNPQERKNLFPNIEKFVDISCQTLANFKNLESSIKEVLPFVSKDIFTTAFPKSWLEIKELLEEKQRKGETHILYQDYLKLCETKEINKSSAGTLVRTLDRMGYVIYYGKNEKLNKWIILNPLWVKDVIYKVLDSDLIQEAKFFPNQFKYVWDEYQPKLLEKGVKTLGEKRKYSSEEHEQFLALMLAYEFCYEQKNRQNESYYIIPALFGDKPPLPENLQAFDYEIKFEYNPFIPAGTVNKLIVRLHRDIHNDLKWKNGVIFIDTENFAFAEVQEVWQEKTVYLKLQGQIVKPLYNRIYQTLLDLNQHLKDTKFLAKLEFKTLVKYKNKWRSLTDIIDFQIEDYEFVLRGSLKKEKTNLPAQKSEKQALLDLINKFELVEVFEKLDELGITHHNLAKLKDEFIGGDYNASFPQRLRLFVNGLDLD